MTKLGLAHFTTKTWTYLGVFGFFRICFANKIQWKIHFLIYLNTDRKAPKKFLNSNYLALCEKTTLETAFGPQEVPKLKNIHFHFHAFSGWGIKITNVFNVE